MFSRSVVLKTLFAAVLVSLIGVNLVSEDVTGIEGKVVDTAEHAPIGNAYVLVHRKGDTDKSSRTDGSGRYVIELLPNIYDVFISADGFAPNCRKIQVPQNGTMVLDAVLDVSNVGMQENSRADEVAPGTARGIAGDVPGGMPLDGTRASAGILSSEPRLPGVGSPTHVRVAQGVMRTFLGTKVNPSYPAEAERQHVEGPVILHISIDKNGNVSKVEPVSGHPLLIPAAIDAVKQWKYKPYLLNQAPVEVETAVLINFVISDGKAFSVIAFTSTNPRN
jgi:TonB family protein